MFSSIAMYHEQFNQSSVISFQTVKGSSSSISAIQLSIIHLFALSLNVKVHSLNVKQFYFTHR